MEGRRHHDDRSRGDASEIALGDQCRVGDGVAGLVLEEDAAAGHAIRRQALGHEVRLGLLRRRFVAVAARNDEGDVAFVREGRRRVSPRECRLGRAAVILEARAEHDGDLPVSGERPRALGHTPNSPTINGRPNFAEP